MDQEHATQSTNPFSSDNSRYRSLRASPSQPGPAQRSPERALEAQDGRHLEGPVDDVVANIVPRDMPWLRLDENDKTTRLLFQPTGSIETFHLEHIGAAPHDDDSPYSEWLEFECGEAEALEVFRVMAVSQSIYHVACRITITSEEPVVKFEITFDPETDNVLLQNKCLQPLTLRKDATSGPGARRPEHVFREMNASLDPGAWSITVQGAVKTKLIVLPRRFLDVGAVEQSKKRSAPSTSQAPKRIKGPSSTSTRVHTMPAVNVELHKPEHPLFRLQAGQTLQLIGSSPLEEYSVTRFEKLSETYASSVWRAIMSAPSGSSAIVAKTLRLGRRNTKVVAEMWLREARIFSKLKPSPDKDAIPTIVQLVGMDSRLYSLYLEDVEAPSLADRCWRQRPDSVFTGPPDVAERVLRDISAALDHVHQRGVVHNDIKPGNILYSDSRGAVLIDFGLSSDAVREAGKVGKGGTPWYIPPEFMGADLSRGFPGDVWAFGVVMIFLFRLLPLPDMTGEWKIAEVESSDAARASMESWLEKVRVARDGLAKSETAGIVRSMTERDPKERITMRAAVCALATIKPGDQGCGGEKSRQASCLAPDS